jgi:hypothetical protein
VTVGKIILQFIFTEKENGMEKINSKEFGYNS